MRDYARTNVTIWQDADFRALPFPAQHLYMTMWTHPDLSYCGVLDWRPGRIAPLSAGWNTQAVRTFADCLAARHFVVIDEQTEEVLIRSWVRWEEILKQPRLSISYVKAFSAVASNDVRRVLVHELAKIKEHTPDLAGFGDQRVLSVLTNPSVSAKDLPVPSDPFATGLDTGLALALGIGLPTGLGQTPPDVCLPPTTAPTPAPLHQEKNNTPSELDADFDEFWSAYPSRGQHANPKKPARAKWDQAIRRGVDPAVMIDGAKRLAASRRGKDPEHTPQATTWLNQERWADEPAPRAEPQVDLREWYLIK